MLGLLFSPIGGLALLGGQSMAKELIKNERVILALKPGSGRLSDGGGLYLLPFARGGETHYWRLDYVFDGRRKTLSLGRFPGVGLERARVLAGEAMSLLHSGHDPSQERQQARHEREAEKESRRKRQAGLPIPGTFEEVARRWFSVKSHQWVENYSSKVIRRLELHAFPTLGHLGLVEISPKQVLDACRDVEVRNNLETAHRLREHCSCVFRFAIAEGLDLRDPCGDIRDALKRPPVRHFPAITRPPQFAELLRSIYDYRGSFVVCCALKLAPMLMVRPGELRKARWEEFDLDNGLWYIPSVRMKRTKDHKLNGQPHLVPLARQAIAVLEALFGVTGKTGNVFPSERDQNRVISENTMNKALRLMGYGASVVTTHGFRATARTLAVELLQFPESVVEAQLAHAVKDANGTAYNRTEFIKLRMELMQSWADYLEDLRLNRATQTHPVLPDFKPVTSRQGPVRC